MVKKMSAVAKKTKYHVICHCGKILKISAKKIHYRIDEYSSDPAVKEKVKVERFWIVCTKCGNHPNVAKIISEEMKNEARVRER
jgi:hypothetical protein